MDAPARRTRGGDGAQDLVVEDGAAPPSKPRSLGYHFVPFAVVALAIFIADQATKLLIVNNLRLYESIPDSGLIRLTHVLNTGSAFGLLRGQTDFLILVSIIGVLGVLFYYRSNGRESALLRYSLALLLGGALGNLTDRLFRGAVVDFISVQVWSDYYFPTFNVADSALTIGLFALAFYVLRNRASEKRLEQQAVAESAPVTTVLPVANGEEPGEDEAGEKSSFSSPNDEPLAEEQRAEDGDSPNRPA